MADDDQSAPDITITVKGPSELKLSITISPSKSVVDLKEAIAKESDVEKDRQRLIYSGKVLKDEDTISQYKIQNGHTIHMVKGAVKPASQPSTSSPAGAAASPRLPQMGTGINPAANPIEGIENVHHGLAGFNPFAQMQGMGNLNDPNAMAEMMNSDAFLQQMADMMGRPEVVDQMIASNPQLAPMRDQIRATMSNPMFRQMMSNPQTLRMIMQMQSQMNQNGGGMGGMGGMGGLGGMGGMGGFPGMFGAPPAAGGNTTGGANAQAPTDPFPNLFAPQAPSTTPSTGTGAAGAGAGAGAAGGNTTGQGAGAAAANPFAAMMGGWPGMGGGAGAGAGAGGEGGNTNAPAFNPWMFNPGMFGGFPQAPAPRDDRPPEEIYATQLGQLNDMGLWDAQKNIRALRSTGGNVQAAIELIFSGQLDAPGGAL